GTVLLSGDRTPVPGITILAVPADADAKLGPVKRKDYRPDAAPAWQAQDRTGDDGTFQLRHAIPAPTKVRVILLAPGYERVEFIESVGAGQTLTVKYFLQRSSTHPYRTVVEAPAQVREEVSRHTITTEEIGALPGTQGDALKAITNFPGINRAPFGIGLLVIRGSDPTDSAVFLAEHEIPQLFHFGGITSVFNSDVLTQIDFIPGNFDSRYGDAIGGVVDVRPRKGRRDGYHGYVDSDLFDTGVLAEGPIGKGSFILAGRRSYIDALLPVFVPDDAGLDIAVAPRYYDYQALFDYPVSNGNLTARLFGSDDRTRLVAADPNDVEPDERDAFETTLVFHRADLAYENHRGRWDFFVSPSYRYDDFGAGALGIFKFRVLTHSFSGRAEATARISDRLKWSVGTQLFAGTFSIDATSPPVPAGGVGEVGTRFSTNTRDSFAAPSLYTTLAVTAGRWTLLPGARLSYYSLQFQDARTDPRLRFRWDVADHTWLKGGAGLYTQIPDPPEWNDLFGNGRIGPETALHTSLAIGHDFVGPSIRVEATGFYKELWDLATQSSVLVTRTDGRVGPENFDNQGRGRIAGGELFVRKDFTRNVFGWVSYTISKSERRNKPSDPWVLFNLDQTHILTLIGVYRLPRGWQIGGRFRVVSGNPFTPVVGSVYDAQDDAYLPVDGPVNSRRVAPFHQLDIRIDRKFTFKRASLTTYIDVQNVYNRQNPEFVVYSYDFRDSTRVPSLPIIPSLGVKLAF
ncbi:MAG: energy transducer TonB, partial [Myxococcota bacterium]